MQVLISIITALALSIGFYFGFKLGRTGELPKLVKTKQEITKEKEEEKELLELQRSLRNMDRYDGSSKGQEDIV